MSQKTITKQVSTNVNGQGGTWPRSSRCWLMPENLTHQLHSIQTSLYPLSSHFNIFFYFKVFPFFPTPFYSDSIFIRPSQFLLSGSDSEMRQGELLSNLFNTKSTAIRAGIFALNGFEGFTQWKCELSLELKSKPTLCFLT